LEDIFVLSKAEETPSLFFVQRLLIGWVYQCLGKGGHGFKKFVDIYIDEFKNNFKR